MQPTRALECAAWPVVHVVGIGDDGVAGLRPREIEIVRRAELLCGGERHLAFFSEHPAERFVIKSNVGALVSLLDKAIGRRRAVVLASGDPCFYGIGPILAERLGRERVCIHPGTSSIALAFSRLGIGWQDASVLSAHGRPLQSVIGPALAARKFAVLTDHENTPAALAAALHAAGMEDAPAYVCEHLGGANERIVEGTLRDLEQRSFAPLNVLVVLREAAMAPATAPFGIDEHAYLSERGQITKAEVRAISLSKLEPWRASIAWDVGAGSGSLAIELAAMMPGGAVFAIERDPRQLDVLRGNLLRYRRPYLTVVEGAAPSALAALPRPNAIFVGGSGAALVEVLEAAAAALLPEGRLVTNFTRIESLAAWQAFARRLGWRQELLQVAIARGVPIGDGTRLAPLNPVFVAVVRCPAESE